VQKTLQAARTLRAAGKVLEHDSHEIFFAHDEELIAVNFDGLTGIFAEQNAIANLDIKGVHFAIIAALARAYGHDFALIGLLGCGIGNDDAGRSFTLFF
jgi:hypothetical protein